MCLFQLQPAAPWDVRHSCMLTSTPRMAATTLAHRVLNTLL